MPKEKQLTGLNAAPGSQAPAAAPEGHCGVGLRRGGVTGLWAPRIRRDYNNHNASGERAAE